MSPAGAPAFEDLRNVERSRRPNDALACSAGMCAAAAEFEIPVFPMTAVQLRQRAGEILSAEPRTTLIAKIENPARLVFVQRSRICRFPDTVRVQAVDVDEGASLIIYSRSDYGFWDIGVNRRRVQRWLSKLKTALMSPQPDQVSSSAQ